MPVNERARIDIAREIRNVIEVEAEALALAAKAVNGSYTKAVELLYRCRGKIIVTGMGKSGLIAQKVAATLASTGSPALYLHPADAMHGDLGTIQRQDIVLCFAKSGESEEITALLPAIKRLGCKLIAITCSAKSTLASASDVVIVIPIEREACPLNLAPTSSTTASLAVGDALAVALMKLRHFQPQQFARFHPGGTLGRKLTLLVSDVMKRGDENPLAAVDAPVSKVLIEMTRSHCGACSVVDAKGRLVGLVTDFDVRKALQSNDGAKLSGAVSKIMNPKPVTVYADQLAADAAEIMSGTRKFYTVLPVLDRRTRRVVGMIRMHELRSRGL